MHTIYAVGSFRLRVPDVTPLTPWNNDPGLRHPPHGQEGRWSALAYPRVATAAARTLRSCRRSHPDPPLERSRVCVPIPPPLLEKAPQTRGFLVGRNSAAHPRGSPTRHNLEKVDPRGLDLCRQADPHPVPLRYCRRACASVAVSGVGERRPWRGYGPGGRGFESIAHSEEIAANRLGTGGRSERRRDCWREVGGTGAQYPSCARARRPFVHFGVGGRGLVTRES